jgi:lysine 2,3-aminomutase
LIGIFRIGDFPVAGASAGTFKELISPFLRGKIAEAKKQCGTHSRQYRALTSQYVASSKEQRVQPWERRRHYEAEVNLEFEGKPIVGIERLYRRTILIEPSTVCAAHCRWCLRGQYPTGAMQRDDIVLAARYIGSPEQRNDIDEVLITGGDPLMTVPLLRFTFEQLAQHAPNVQTVRIGTRVPFQAPERVNDALLELLSDFDGMRIELGLHINHPVEFWPESVESINRLRNVGVRMYNQNPLLKGVNDDLATLIELCSLLRAHQIEAHYLFHAIPMQGMHHHRTSVAKGLELARAISACGEFSGRAKPKYAVLSDIGKIVLYHDTIVDNRPHDNSLLLRSGFRLSDRLKWNPGWKVPDSVVIDNSGTMMTWYQDGTDETDASCGSFDRDQPQ